MCIYSPKIQENKQRMDDLSNMIDEGVKQMKTNIPQKTKGMMLRFCGYKGYDGLVCFKKHYIPTLDIYDFRNSLFAFPVDSMYFEKHMIYNFCFKFDELEKIVQNECGKRGHKYYDINNGPCHNDRMEIRVWDEAHFLGNETFDPKKNEELKIEKLTFEDLDID